MALALDELQLAADSNKKGALSWGVRVKLMSGKVTAASA